MHNAKIPSDVELPSSMQLLKSTILALIVALALLFTVILPAEYGVDPTGVGKTLGLTQMGEIKQQLANEALLEEQQVNAILSQPDAEDEAPEEPTIQLDTPVEATADVIPSETRSVVLQPGGAAEIKIGMTEGSVVTYDWSVNTGHVNYDTHGDNANVSYFGYNKGTATTQDSGELQAVFDGKHGWFWRNRSNETVTVTLNVTGSFSSIERVL